MAEGTNAYDGLAVGLHGEYEMHQVAGDEAIDILTLTGSTGTQTGDFLVAQSGAGTEVFVVSASGAITAAAGISGLTASSLTLSSTAANGYSVAVTSTGAIASGSYLNSAFYVSMSSKAVLNSILTYVGSCTGGEVGSCNSVFATYGSKAPSYFIATGTTVAGVGAVGDNGFVLSGQFLVSALATTVPISAIKVLLGSGTYYIPCLTTTTLAAS